MSATEPEHAFPEPRPGWFRLSARSWGLVGGITIVAASLAGFQSVGLSPRMWVTRDDRPAFEIDPATAFQLEFARGSTLDGFDTVKLDQTGQVVLHRRSLGRYCETTTLQLSTAAVGKVIESLAWNRMTTLHRAYHADVHDGTQWIFWLKQGNQEKAIFFNNNFPAPITRFAAQLDAILSNAGLNEVAWERVPPGDCEKQVSPRMYR